MNYAWAYDATLLSFDAVWESGRPFHYPTWLSIPFAAPSNASFMGGFGKRLFEPSDLFGEFPIAAHEAE